MFRRFSTLPLVIELISVNCRVSRSLVAFICLSMTLDFYSKSTSIFAFERAILNTLSLLSNYRKRACTDDLLPELLLLSRLEADNLGFL